MTNNNFQGTSFEDLFRSNMALNVDWKPHASNKASAIDVVDFFSGCGGMSLGFSALSQNEPIFNLLGAVDINPTALESYKKNFRTKTLHSDIGKLCNAKGVRYLKEYFGIEDKKSRPLVVIGCAPCQGFTSHRKKSWHIEDDRNTLIGAFSDIAVELDPDYIVMENVPEILGKKYWQHYQEAREVFESQDYNVVQTIYNSAQFGVPQARFRAVVIASKSDFEMPPPVFGEDEFITVRDAISDLPEVAPGQVCKNDPFHRSAKHKQSTIDTISAVAKNGGSRPSGIGPESLDKFSGYYDVYGRLFWDKPAITLTQYARNPASGRYSHPEQNRGLTIREAARLQSFPDAYEFVGSLDKCFKQLGESVPPLLSLAIAQQIAITELDIQLDSSQRQAKIIDSPVTSSFSSLIASLKRVR